MSCLLLPISLRALQRREKFMLSKTFLVCAMFLFTVLFFCVVGHAAEQVKGTARYRERITLPPGAVFEATLEDVSTADAKIEVIGRARIEQPGSPPIAFEIPYDSAR